jgi:hypothetical protein
LSSPENPEGFNINNNRRPLYPRNHN